MFEPPPGAIALASSSGARVFGSVRKQADGDRLSAEFGPNFTPLLFDVTDQAAVAAGARADPSSATRSAHWANFLASVRKSSSLLTALCGSLLLRRLITSQAREGSG